MYQIVLAAALATSAQTPNHCWFRAGCHGYYGCHACNGCHGCDGGPVGYGAAGGCYGYHGGCYGGWGVYTGEPFYGCTGCYGCYGGYACYGVPVPIVGGGAPPTKDSGPPDVKKKQPEEI